MVNVTHRKYQDAMIPVSTPSHHLYLNMVDAGEKDARKIYPDVALELDALVAERKNQIAEVTTEQQPALLS